MHSLGAGNIIPNKNITEIITRIGLGKSKKDTKLKTKSPSRYDMAGVYYIDCDTSNCIISIDYRTIARFIRVFVGLFRQLIGD